jgi:hypothetical protein
MWVRNPPPPLNFASESKDDPGFDPAWSAQSRVHKIQFNGGGGLRTHISFTRSRAQS